MNEPIPLNEHGFLDELSRNDFRALVAAIYLAAVGIMLFFACVAALILLWVMVKWMKKALRLFGRDGSSQAVSLGIASLIFPRAIANLYYCLLDFFNRLFADLPSTFAVPVSTVIDNVSPGNIGANLGMALIEPFRRLCLSVGRLTEAFQRMPVGDLVSLVAVGAALNFVIGAFIASDAAAAPGKATSWFNQLSQKAKGNLYFSLTLLMAIYLAMASLSAIPELQEVGSASTAFSKERLTAALQAVRSESDSVLTQARPNFTPPAKDGDAPEHGDATHPVDPAKPPKGEAPRNDDGIPAAGMEINGLNGLAETEKAYLQPVFAAVSEQTSELLIRYQDALRSLKEGRESALNIATTAYEAENQDRKGTRESARYYQDMIGWYREKLSALEDNVKYAAKEMDRLEGQRRSLYRIIKTQFDQNKNADDRAFYFRALSQSAIAIPISRPSVSVNLYGDLPERLALGSQLGLFSVLSSWLLRAESLPLALIVGMVGFGLLGASCSTYIRQKGSRPDDASIVKDISSIIIPGVSAAVVVFLGVEGGILVFASGVGQPNPYLLLLICLVASIFSESVWEWAQAWLAERLPKNQPKPRAAEGGEAEAPLK